MTSSSDSRGQSLSGGVMRLPGGVLVGLAQSRWQCRRATREGIDETEVLLAPDLTQRGVTLEQPEGLVLLVLVLGQMT